MTATGAFADWAQLADGERTAAIATCCARTARIGRKLNAVVFEFVPAIAKGGPLQGMPFVVKDMFATGLAAPSGGFASPILDLPVQRASVIDRLDAAGGTLIAAAEMTELAYEPSGQNASRGRVHNPWNFDAVTGGSSSGAAALVASGCCAFALGSDTGGSVRIPASCCAVTSLKPGHGRLPVDGVIALAPSLDTVGVIARSAADLALAWSALTGEAARIPSRRLKAAVLTDTFAESEPTVATVCDNAVRVLSQHMDVTGRAGFPEAADANGILVLQAEAARTHRSLIEDASIDATLRKRLGKGLKIGDRELADALSARSGLLYDFVENQLVDADIAILPTMPIATPRATQTDPASTAFSPQTLYAMSRLTRFVNYLGLPALSLPVGFDNDGLPIGLQIVGLPNSEALLLRIAMQYQSVTNWHGRVPTAIAADIAGEDIVA